MRVVANCYSFFVTFSHLSFTPRQSIQIPCYESNDTEPEGILTCSVVEERDLGLDSGTRAREADVDLQRGDCSRRAEAASLGRIACCKLTTAQPNTAEQIWNVAF